MNTLKIVSDISQGGPYLDPKSGSTITFNGEIYNFRELAKEWEINLELDETDAELVLLGYLKYGLEIIEQLDGMFAFAIYDQKFDSDFKLVKAESTKHP